MSTPDGKGKLYYKFNNYKRKFNESDAEKSVDDDDNEDDKSRKPMKKKKKTQHKNSLTTLDASSDADHIRKVKYENLNMEETLSHWRGCVATRLNHIRTHGLKNYYTEWPQYNTPRGFQFVSMLKKRYIIEFYYYGYRISTA